MHGTRKICVRDTSPEIHMCLGTWIHLAPCSHHFGTRCFFDHLVHTNRMRHHESYFYFAPRCKQSKVNALGTIDIMNSILEVVTNSLNPYVCMCLCKLLRDPILLLHSICWQLYTCIMFHTSTKHFLNCF